MRKPGSQTSPCPQSASSILGEEKYRYLLYLPRTFVSFLVYVVQEGGIDLVWNAHAFSFASYFTLYCNSAARLQRKMGGPVRSRRVASRLVQDPCAADTLSCWD